ncbi:MAG: DNA polymerase Y family protein [Jiangellaceae bacterium]
MSSARALVAWCPDWPVVAAGVDTGDPAAVVAGGRVTACTAAARESGVRRGQRLRDAQRHCPGLAVHAEDPEGEARCFEQVAAAVEALCPRVEVVRPGVCAVPARGPARYFGGEQALADLIREAVAGCGFLCAVGVADGVFAAVLAAREGPAGMVVPAGETAQFLAPHPVSALAAAVVGSDGLDLIGLLNRLGIRTLGQFAALPAGDVLTRFGVDGAIAHRLASGLEPRPPATRPPGEDLAAVLTFDPPAEQSEPLVFVAKSLADELHAGLAARGLACVRVEVEVSTEDGRSWSRLWRHDGLLSSTGVAERVRWQLDAWRTASPGSPDALVGGVVLLRLAPDQVVVDAGRQLALWGSEVADGRVERAATRLQAMLGHAAVTRPVLAGGRGPGEQVLRVPWGDRLEPRLPAAGPWPGRVPAPAPAVVHPSPVPAVVIDDDGLPVNVSGRCEVSSPPSWLAVDGGSPLAVTGWTGPWPVVEHWWDAVLARRSARFQVSTDDGRAWLLVVDRGRWRVEATYD